MRFRLDANLPRSAAAILRQPGHEAFDVHDIGRCGADDTRIAAHAEAIGLFLVTRDFDAALSTELTWRISFGNHLSAGVRRTKIKPARLAPKSTVVAPLSGTPVGGVER